MSAEAWGEDFAVCADQDFETDMGFDAAAAKGALDELFQLAQQFRHSDKFLELLKFISGFRRYSAFNAMLVYVQMPGARYVLPAKAWLKEYQRRPTADAQPLVMLQPRSPVMFAFDVSQTEGEPLPLGFGNPFETSGRLPRGAWERTIANARRDGVDVQMRALGSTLGGYVRRVSDPNHDVLVRPVQGPIASMRVGGRDVELLARVVLNDNLPDETSYATLTHELGHLYCGHVGSPNPRWWPDRRGLGVKAKEFEAEAVSYLVCLRAGLETPAVSYLHGYLEAHDQVPAISLDTVFKAAQRIEAMRLKTMRFRESD